MSGPVAGLMGGLWAGKLSGYEEVITLDVGGTSADIGVAPGGELRLKHLLDTQIAGYHAMIPMAELDTIGAGGGSLAYVDEAGMFHVGPAVGGRRARVPPATCAAATRPTVTDAMMVLGKLRPESFLAGSMTVDPALAEQALREHVCEPLGIDLIEAAASTVGVITHSMIQAIELNSVQKGYDPRDFTLVALGGAGAPVRLRHRQRDGHPARARPAATRASPPRSACWRPTRVYEFSTTEMTPLAELDWARVQEHFAAPRRARRASSCTATAWPTTRSSCATTPTAATPTRATS